MASATETPEATPALPAGEYAIVEILGHRTLVGRVTEVERFGSKLMSIEPIFRGGLLDGVLIGGSSIYQFTPCSAEAALRRAPDEDWSLPKPIRDVLPEVMLGAPGAFDPPAFLGQPERRCPECGDFAGECDCVPF